MGNMLLIGLAVVFWYAVISDGVRTYRSSRRNRRR
jgi:hypothetical protein